MKPRQVLLLYVNIIRFYFRYVLFKRLGRYAFFLKLAYPVFYFSAVHIRRPERPYGVYAVCIIQYIFQELYLFKIRDLYFILYIINCLIRLQDNGICKTVKRACLDIVTASAEYLYKAFFHCLGGSIRIGEYKYVFRAYLFLVYYAGGPYRQKLGLSCARACEHKQRPMDKIHCLFLRLVKLVVILVKGVHIPSRHCDCAVIVILTPDSW